MKLCVPRTIKMAKEAASCKIPGSRKGKGQQKKERKKGRAGCQHDDDG